MRKRILAWMTGTAAVTASVMGLLLAYGADEAAAPKVNDKGATVEGTQAVVDGANQAALALYAKLADKPGNVFFSPYSIATALAMTGEGARGQTAEEIRAVFHLPPDDAARRASFAALHNALNTPDSAYQLSVANALWTQTGYQLEPDFLRVVKDYYGGGATPVDFNRNTEGARQTINRWVEQRTQDRIKDLFAKGTLDESARLVLTNAIFFKGTWDKQFDPKQTQEGSFTPSGGAPVRAKLMHVNEAETKFGYAEADGIQVLDMPYAGGKLSMLVLLPKAGEMEKLESMLSPAKLAEWRGALTTKRVDVTLPKFTVNTKYELNGPLAALGMPTAFNPDTADFTGLAAKDQLYIDLVIHQAFVEVNEEGTEAAAATGVPMRTASAMMPQPIPVFRADHPFIYLIVEKQHGTVLFLGRMDKPG